MLKIKRILCPTDFSDCSDKAYRHALNLAVKYASELHLLHVINIYPYDPSDPEYHYVYSRTQIRRLERHVREKCAQIIDRHGRNGTHVFSVCRQSFSPPATILTYAEDNDIDQIVMGTHGRRGLGYLFLGSVAEEVTKISSCPVYTIREKKDAKSIENFHRIPVPVDLSDYSKRALQYARIFCQDYKAELDILHVVEEKVHPALYATGKKSVFDFMPDIKEKSLNLMKKMLQEVPGRHIQASFTVIEGIAPREILKYCETNRIDLIVNSTHGISGLNHFLAGSVYEKIVRRSVPVRCSR